MPVAEYDQYDALGLAELVRTKQVSPEDLLNEAIRRCDAVNPAINAVILRMDDEAHRTLRAGLPDGPFQGVPFLIKDLLAAYKGVRMTQGSRAYANYIPDYDSEMVVRFRNAGLVIFGKTNTPEFGITGTTEPRLHGITRNPWNLERTAGGSSGGSAAAVAAGIVPMASGGDGGGSLRIPASCCAWVGFKPSRGRNPYGPVQGDPWYGQVQEGVLSRTVRDTAAALDATQGPDVGAPYTAPPPKEPFLKATQQPCRSLRIGYCDRPLMLDNAFDPDVVEALERTVERLRQLGHDLRLAIPPLDKRTISEGYLMRVATAVAGDVAEAEAWLGRRAQPNDFEPETWALARLGQSFRAADFDRMQRALLAQGRVFAHFLKEYDVFLTPTLGKPPHPMGCSRPREPRLFSPSSPKDSRLAPLPRHLPVLKMLAEANFQWVTATPLMNISGHPSVSLPLEWNAEGLPIDMMFTARMYDEATLFRLAAQLEKELGFMPPVQAKLQVPTVQAKAAST